MDDQAEYMAHLQPLPRCACGKPALYNGRTALVHAHHYERVTDPEPYDAVLFCGICHREVHVTRALAGMTMAFHDPLDAEIACQVHFSLHHPRRYWLYQLLGWRWLIGGLVR